MDTKKNDRLMVELLGMLYDDYVDKTKIPIHYRIISGEEIPLTQAAGIECLMVPEFANFKTKLAWVPPYVRSLIDIYYFNDGYANLTLTEFLVRSYTTK